MNFSALPCECEGRTFNGVDINSILPNIEVHKVVEIDSVKFHISRPIAAPFRKNSFFTVAVEHNGAFKLRTFFLSRSQGVWRMLKGYKFKTRDDGSEKPTWNDKGYNEHSLLIPLKLQKTLFELATEEPLEIENSISLFYGTTPLNGDKNYYEEYIKPNGTHLDFVNYEAVTPEDLTTPDYRPELAIIDQWNTTNSLYSNLNYKLVQFEGKQLLLIETDDNRYFIGGFEDATSPITPIGLREQWIDAGKLTTPLFEYKNEQVDHSHGYGNEEIRSGNYVDMYKNYLSKIYFLSYVSRAI